MLSRLVLGTVQVPVVSTSRQPRTNRLGPTRQGCRGSLDGHARSVKVWARPMGMPSFDQGRGKRVNYDDDNDDDDDEWDDEFDDYLGGRRAPGTKLTAAEKAIRERIRQHKLRIDVFKSSGLGSMTIFQDAMEKKLEKDLAQFKKDQAAGGDINRMAQQAMELGYDLEGDWEAVNGATTAGTTTGRNKKKETESGRQKKRATLKRPPSHPLLDSGHRKKHINSILKEFNTDPEEDRLWDDVLIYKPKAQPSLGEISGLSSTDEEYLAYVLGSLSVKKRAKDSKVKRKGGTSTGPLSESQETEEHLKFVLNSLGRSEAGMRRYRLSEQGAAAGSDEAADLEFVLQAMAENRAKSRRGPNAQLTTEDYEDYVNFVVESIDEGMRVAQPLALKKKILEVEKSGKGGGKDSYLDFVMQALIDQGGSFVHPKKASKVAKPALGVVRKANAGGATTSSADVVGGGGDSYLDFVTQALIDQGGSFVHPKKPAKVAKPAGTSLGVVRKVNPGEVTTSSAGGGGGDSYLDFVTQASINQGGSFVHLQKAAKVAKPAGSSLGVVRKANPGEMTNSLAANPRAEVQQKAPTSASTPASVLSQVASAQPSAQSKPRLGLVQKASSVQTGTGMSSPAVGASAPKPGLGPRKLLSSSSLNQGSQSESQPQLRSTPAPPSASRLSPSTPAGTASPSTPGVSAPGAWGAASSGRGSSGAGGAGAGASAGAWGTASSGRGSSGAGALAGGGAGASAGAWGAASSGRGSSEEAELLLFTLQALADEQSPEERRKNPRRAKAIKRSADKLEKGLQELEKKIQIRRPEHPNKPPAPTLGQAKSKAKDKEEAKKPGNPFGSYDEVLSRSNP